MKALLHRWRHTNEWLRALFVAMPVLMLLHLFVVRWVTVQNTSMYSTLLPGDLVAVNLLAGIGGYEVGDVVVFRDPVQDDRAMAARDLLVKRIVAMPGDTLRIKGGVVFVNDEPMPAPEGATRSWLVRLKKEDQLGGVLTKLGLPSDFAPTGRTFIELPLNETLVEDLSAAKLIADAEDMGTDRGAPDHIFPYSPTYRFNADNYGPLAMPRSGDTVRIDVGRLPLYDRIITRYEGHVLEASGNNISMDGKPLEKYIIEGDYCFVMGDSRNHSSDSRYWGFLPMDHVVGRAAFVLLGQDGERGGFRSGRWFKDVD